MKENQTSLRSPAYGSVKIITLILSAFLSIASISACGRAPSTMVDNSAGSSTEATIQASDTQMPESQAPGSQTAAPQSDIPQSVVPTPAASGGVSPTPAAEPSPITGISLEKSKSGAMLDESIDKDLHVRLLMMEEYSLKGFQTSFGTDLIQSADGIYERFSYPNGVYFNTWKDGTVAEIGMNDGKVTIYPEQIRRMRMDIFPNPGDEWLILYECDMYYRLLVLDGTTQAVLREYETGFLNILDVQIGDILREGGVQLYLDGYADGTDKRAIYRVVADDFVQVYDLGSFAQYKDGIKATISNSLLRLDVQLEGNSEKKELQLPERLFYDNRDISDKNTLLAIHPSWHVLEKDGQWFLTVRNSVDFDMLGYFWGPPGENMDDNNIMLNDLARVDILLAMDKGTPKIVEIKTSVKYDDPALLAVKPILREEGRLLEGPVLESTMEQAFSAAGGDMNTFEYAEQLTVNGISLYEFTGSIVDITVTAPGHATTRGMKVGDSIQTVERLYGKPDAGFSGDESVSYKSVFDDQKKPALNYYRGLDISYLNGTVKSFTVYQVILD